MYTNIFDSHAHYDDQRFDDDRDQLLASLAAGGVVGIMNAASDLDCARKALAMAERHPFLHCAAGVHPHEAQNAPADYLDQLEALCAHPRVRAVGEIGLDYHYDFSPRPLQQKVFEEQLLLANRLGLPVIIHDREAHGDTLELLGRHKPRGVVHCYSGSAEMAKELLALGLYIGFTGAVTFKNARRALEAAAVIPDDRLLVETDCPYMAPEPHRGTRCDSSLLPFTAKALAQVRGTDVEHIFEITCKNARELFAVGE